MTTVTGNDYYPREPGKAKNHYNINGNGKLGDDEKEQFLSPVRIEPGLDSLNRNPEECELQSCEGNAPPDRLHIVFFIMVIHGIGILMPWNMLINAQAYFENYKLSANTTEVNNLRSNFMFSIGVASQVPNFIMSGVNTFCQCGGQASSKRIAISIGIMTVVFVSTVILAMVDSSDWSVEFFYITMGSAVILNMATGVYQNSTFGLAAILPMKYTNAIVLGNNLSGVFIAVINLVCLALAPNPRTQAIYYFVTAIVILLIAFDAYFLLPITNYYKHHKAMVVRKQKQQRNTNRNCSETCSMYWMVFKKIWVQAVSVWFVFFVTLTIFPGLWANVKRIDFPIHDDFWAPVFCFLSFNLFAFLGNLTSEFIRVPGEKWVWIPVVIRGVLIPFFLMCNFKPEERIFDVIIENDYIYIVGGVVVGFTSGYFSSLCMMYGPKLVEQEYAGTAGMIMAFFLVLGIGTGVNFSLALGMILTEPKV